MKTVERRPRRRWFPDLKAEALAWWVRRASDQRLQSVMRSRLRGVWGAKTRSGFGTRRSSALPRSIVACSAGDPWTARKRRFRAAPRGSDTRRQPPDRIDAPHRPELVGGRQLPRTEKSRGGEE